MIQIDERAIVSAIDLEKLIDRLEMVFANQGKQAERTIVALPRVGLEERVIAFMPAFDAAGGVVKLFTSVTDNYVRGLPNIQAVVIVFSEHGSPIAVLEGTSITRYRTSAASALGSKYLSRDESSRLVLIGDGALAPTLAAAHCLVRPIRDVRVFGIDPKRVDRTVTTIKAMTTGVEVHPGFSLEEAVQEADIVSCATNSSTPVFQGRWLKPGAHVDLVGSFSPSKRESDDDAVRHSRIFVDTFSGALPEAGDIIIPLTQGVITREQILGELTDLINRTVCGRRSATDITVFKSVGAAMEDLAAARLVLELHGAAKLS